MDLFPRAADAWFYYSLLSPVLALAANVVAQVLLVRLRRGSHFLRSVAEGCLCGGGVLAVLEAIRIRHLGVSPETLYYVLLVNAPAYLALSYCYFNFANLGQASIRIRIYNKIAKSPDGLRIEDLTREYNEQSLMEMRLHRLLESGDLVEKNGVLHIGRPRLAWAAKIIFAAKQFVLGKASEFE
ncbi:MAG: hypothetical protein PHD76_11740 [Methylacidiphilales bacterium]|nr:hypothetical protein [Candidatus Methylacidiphilales bacterium]